MAVTGTDGLVQVDKDQLRLTVNCLPETFESVCTQVLPAPMPCPLAPTTCTCFGTIASLPVGEPPAPRLPV